MDAFGDIGEERASELPRCAARLSARAPQPTDPPAMGDPRCTIVVASRDRHAELLTTLAVVASSLDSFALEIRHLARTEVAEVQEPFGQGQKGFPDRRRGRSNWRGFLEWHWQWPGHGRGQSARTGV